MATENISLVRHNQIAILELNRGATNAINLQLMHEITRAVETVRQDPSMRALVLTSSNQKFFSIGFDIPALLDFPREEFAAFFRAINQLFLDIYTLPKPTAAAITGHAIAGGCILTLCCDTRFISEGHKLMGLNEVKLGVPVPYPADRILSALVGPRIARQVMESGDFYPPEEALAMGLVDRVMPIEQVRPQAIQDLESLAAMPEKAFAIIKANRVEPVLEQIQEKRDQRAEAFRECWYADDTRQRLVEAAAKF